MTLPCGSSWNGLVLKKRGIALLSLDGKLAWKARVPDHAAEGVVWSY